MTNESLFGSMTAPRLLHDASGREEGPSTIASARDIPLRVLVRNTSLGASVFLAFDAPALQVTPQPGGASYELPAGAADVFVVDIGQKLLVMSASDNTTISYAISRALPEAK
jgi:hypothetical protein